MSDLTPRRTALLGYGLGGSLFHAPFIDTTDGLALTTIVTSNPERQAAARLRYGDVSVLASPDDLWAQAEQHDLVVISTSNDSHVALATAALQHGLHVVVDKPITPTSSAGHQLIALAAAEGRLLSVFQNRRWDGDFLTLRRLIADGRLGQVTRFESRFERFRPVADTTRWRESAQPEMAGGLLFDLGSHLVDQAVVLFGPPVSVYAEVIARRVEVAVDDDMFVALTHAGGERSHLWASAVTPLLGPRFRVLGSTGGYVSWGLDPQEDALKAGGVPGTPGWGQLPEDRWGRLGTDASSERIETEPGAYQRYYEAIAASLLRGLPVPVPAAESVRVIEILEAARESSRTGTVVGFPRTPGPS